MRSVFALLAVMLASPAAGQQTAKPIPIRIETQFGNIDAELDSANAPVTVTNFLRYVDGQFFDQGTFFRAVTLANQPKDSVKIEVIQGGIGPAKRSQAFPAIPLERTTVTHLHHGDGTLSMARSGPDTGTNQFFITVGDQPALDFGGHRNPDGQGFAAFGRVTKGMDIVRKIQTQPVNAQAIVSPVTIVRIVRR